VRSACAREEACSSCGCGEVDLEVAMRRRRSSPQSTNTVVHKYTARIRMCGDCDFDSDPVHFAT
jgi:hypothetical protein